MTIPPPVEILGIVAIATMVVCYALEKRGTVFIAAFAAGCALAALYAYLIGSYPFLVAEAIWAVVAARRWQVARRLAQRCTGAAA